MAERRGPTQIENRNFLAPVGFKFNLQRSPGVAYFCNQANIPDITLGVAQQVNYLRDRSPKSILSPGVGISLR